MEIEKIQPKKISKKEIHTVIKFIWMDNKNQQEIIEKINSMYEFGTVCQYTVYKWYNRFSDGDLSIKDREKKWRTPINNLNKNNTKLLNEDKYISAKSIWKQLNHHTLTITSHMKSMKFYERKNKKIPHKLTDEQKINRMNISKEMVNVFENIIYP